MPPRVLSRQYGRQPSEAVRAALLSFTLTFVRAARTVAGVERLALVGSLATPKLYPKDVDLLVTLADDADVAPLATLGRQLQGRAQGLNSGADIFLASPSGVYLGRTCPWRACAPAQRARCGARYRTGRPYVRDDLGVLVLPPALIAAPPLELWPGVVARGPVPGDVEAVLLAPLREDADRRVARG